MNARVRAPLGIRVRRARGERARAHLGIWRPLKQVVDQWLARTRLGRRAALSTYPIEILVGPQQKQDECHLPLLWDEALQDIRALRLRPLSNTRAGILSHPIWYNP